MKDFAIKDKIKELVYRIESDHFPEIAQRDNESDENIDLLLKDYSDVIGHVILRTKAAGLHYLSDALELFWKFLIVALDKLFGIKQRQLENLFNDKVARLTSQVNSLRDQLLENERRYKSRIDFYENRLKLFLEKKRFQDQMIANLQSELDKFKRTTGQDNSENKETLLGKFEDMQENLKKMSNHINEAANDNHEQNQLVRRELLHSIMGIFNKGFRCNSKQVGTQTDLSLCSKSAVVYKYGIEETVIPETKILPFFRHPFLPFLVVDSDAAVKPRIEEQIDFIEQHLDKRKRYSLVKDAGIVHSLPDFIIDNMKANQVTFGNMCLRISVLALTLDKLRKSSHPYEKLCGRLLGMFGEKMVTSSTLRQFLRFRDHVAHCLKIGSMFLLRKTVV